MKYVANQWALIRGQSLRFICLLTDTSGTAYNCYYDTASGATEIEVKFQNQDGSYLSKRKSLGQLQLLDYGPPTILICSLLPAETLALKKGISTVSVSLYDLAGNLRLYFPYSNAMSAVDPEIP